jgi:putative ABC transport system permease protein
MTYLYRKYTQLNTNENIKVALGSVKAQRLRTTLTALIIAIGIMALVGILTAIDAIESSINSSFSSMGANTFTIRNYGMGIRIGRDGKRPKRFQQISFNEAQHFKEQYSYPAVVSISTTASMVGVLKFKNIESNPNVTITGADEGYLAASGYRIRSGRNFSNLELESGGNVVLLGYEMANTLFKSGEDPLDQLISVGNNKYRVIAVLEEKGSSFAFSGDKVCIIPLMNVRQRYGDDNRSYTISVKVNTVAELDQGQGEAIGTFRTVRGDMVGEDNSFEIVQSDSLANIVISQLDYVTIAATIIGFITLLGASIGLMNIMLVSVTERTREIGIRKSLGASKQHIKRQFLVEAIVICQMGGLLGIVLGVGMGNLMGLFFAAGFIIPWKWMISGVVLCFIVGVISGMYPAIKASNLDPIEALRHE